MLVKYHVIFGFFASLLIWLIFPQIGWFYASVILLSSVLIDVDHYLYYVWIKKDWNLSYAYRWFSLKLEDWRKLPKQERHQFERQILFMHGIEFILLTSLLIFVHKIFLFILIGFLIHLALDFIDLIIHKEPLYIKISPILVYKRNKNKKRFA